MSHQGLFLSSYLNSLDSKFICFDLNYEIIDKLNDKNESLSLENLINKNLKKKKINITNNFQLIKKCNYLIISQDVEIDEFGNKNLKKINFYINQIIKYSKKNSIVILMSQIDIGYTRKIYNKEKFYLKNIFLINTPNTLVIGDSYNSFNGYKEIIIGVNNTHNIKNNFFIKGIKEFASILNKKYYLVSFETVELSKEALMLKLALDVSFSNFISHFSYLYNSDYENVVNYLKNDKRFSKYAYWKPSLGFAGGHTERSLNFFERFSNGNQKKFINEIKNFNQSRIAILKKNIINLKLKPDYEICIIGIAYKQNTNSTLNSFAFQLISLFKKSYFNYFDSTADFNLEIKLLKNPKKKTDLESALHDCKALIILNLNLDVEYLILNKSLFKKHKIKFVIDPLKYLINLKKYFINNKIKYVNLFEK